MSLAAFNASVTIATKGVAVQLPSYRLRHFYVIAYDDNVGSIVIGIGSGTNTSRGNFFKTLRPGDEREFIGTHIDMSIETSDLWINNDASTGNVGDGVVLVKVSRE